MHEKNSPKAQSKYQNKTQTWQKFWNYQIENQIRNSKGEFEITMVNMLRAVMKEIDSVQNKIVM